MPSDFQDGDIIEAVHLKQYSGEAYYSDAITGSTSSAYLATVTPAPLSGYPVGMVVNFKPNADNAVSPTLNVNGLGAKSIVKNGTTPLAAVDLKNGEVVTLIYDGTNFQLVAASIPPLRYLEAYVAYQMLNAPGDYVAYQSAVHNTTGLTYSNGTFTATIAGWYAVDAMLYSDVGTAYAAILRNDLDIYRDRNGPLSAGAKITGRVYLEIGDTLGVALYLQTGYAAPYYAGPWAYLFIALEGR